MIVHQLKLISSIKKVNMAMSSTILNSTITIQFQASQNSSRDDQRRLPNRTIRRSFIAIKWHEECGFIFSIWNYNKFYIGFNKKQQFDIY